MRPERAHRHIRRAILLALKGDTRVINQSTTLIAIFKLDKKLKASLGSSYALYVEGLPPEKSEYGRSYHELLYISDRFNTPHRLGWLGFGIVNELFTPHSVKAPNTFTDELDELAEELLISTPAEDDLPSVLARKQ